MPPIGIRLAIYKPTQRNGIRSSTSRDLLFVCVPVRRTAGALSAEITVTHDLPVAAHALCYGDVSVPFQKSDTSSQLKLEVAYSRPQQNASLFCHFKRAAGLYTVSVSVALGGQGQFLLMEEKRYTVVCARGKQATNTSETKAVVVPIVRPAELQQQTVATVPELVHMTVIDIKGNEIVEGIPVGKMVALRAELTNVYETTLGFTPSSCGALAMNKGTRYSFLRGGQVLCGDGLILDRSAGFNTTGTTVTSPYFPFFKVGGDTSMKFMCNFTVCSESCDGDSCADVPVERRKREIPDLIQTDYTPDGNHGGTGLDQYLAGDHPGTGPSVLQEGDTVTGNNDTMNDAVRTRRILKNDWTNLRNRIMAEQRARRMSSSAYRSPLMYRDYIPKKILPVPPQSVLTTLELRFINDCVRTSRQGPVLRLPSIQPYACSGTSRKHPYVGDNKANSKEKKITTKKVNLNKLSARRRCIRTPPPSYFLERERSFIVDAISVDKCRTRFKDVLPPYDATKDAHCATYFKRSHMKQFFVKNAEPEYQQNSKDL
ncbi:hypothetical protein ScPMuIL_012336 [Solemya velum]